MLSRLRVLIFTLTIAFIAFFSWFAPTSQAAGEPPTPSAIELNPAEWASIQAQLPTQINSPAALAVTQIATVTADIPDAGDHFGYDVDVYGDIAVVGVPKRDEVNNPDAGAAYIFYRNIGAGGIDNWGFVKKIIASDMATGAEFGSAVAVYGDTIVVGAPLADITAGDDRGAAYVFVRNNGGLNAWNEVAKLSTATGTPNPNLGKAVDIFGDTIVVGARESAYVYYRNEDGLDEWGYVNQLTAPLPSMLGTSVAIYGDIIVLGGPTANVSKGIAYVYYRNDGGADMWGLRQELSASDGVNGDQFGISVALEQDTVVVGSLNADIDGQLNRGAAYIYHRNTGGINQWDEVTKLVGPGDADDQFGVSVALDQDVIAVGANGAANGGSVYLYERNYGGAEAWNIINTISAPAGSQTFGQSVALYNGVLLSSSPASNSAAGLGHIFYVSGSSWNEIDKPVASGGQASDQLGYSIALHNDTLVVGAINGDGAVAETGTAYVFERNITGPDEWGLVAVLTATDGLAGDDFGRAVTIWDDTIAVGAPEKNSGTGGVYLFLRNSGGVDNWGQYKMFNGTAGQKYGSSVSLSGDLLAIGAPNPTGIGSVMILERNINGLDGWGLMKQITTGASGDQFGYAVALDIDTLVVGAPFTDPSALTDAGSAYLFERNQVAINDWGQVRQLAPATNTANNHFGWSVALSDDTAVVGVPDLDVNAQTDAGGAVLFVRNNGGANNWGLRTTLTDSAGLANDRFGFAVSIWLDKVAVGAPRRQVGANVNQGAILLFERNQGGLDAWGFQHRLTASDGAAEDRLGFAVALNSYHLAGGAINANINTQDNQGAAYVYRWETNTRTLSVGLGGQQTGQVTSNPAGINCAVICLADFAPGSVVTLTATADVGSGFGGWSGACAGTQTTCVVTLNANTHVTATFAMIVPPVNKTLTVVKEGTGQGSVTSNPAGIACGSDCSQTYTHGTIVTLTATAEANSSFAGWDGPCFGLGACVVDMSHHYTVTAQFNLTAPNSFTLTVGRDGSGSTNGVVASSPAGIDCGVDCSEIYTSGITVTLTATPITTDTFFVGWSGACTGVGPCLVPVTANTHVTATFNQLLTNTFPLSVDLVGTGLGTVNSSPAGINCGIDCSEAYISGTVVTLTATTSPTSTFAGWSGGGCSGIANCVVTVDGATQVRATFNLIPVTTQHKLFLPIVRRP